MTFHAPFILAALLAVPAGIALYVRGERGRRSRQAFVSPHLAQNVTPRRPRWRRHVPIAAHAVALGALIVALARPETTVAVPVEQATVVVATDRSGSMLAKDVSPSRLVAARHAAETFLDAVPKDVRVGAIAFNHEPSVLQSPTRDHEAVRTALRGVRAAGSTATGDALAAALELAKTSQRSAGKRAPAAIVLLSDGKSVRGRDVLQVAEEARKAKIPVYTVALGTTSGTIESRSSSGAVVQRRVPPDPATLRKVAERTGGKAFAIEDAKALNDVYKRLGSKVATEKRKQEVTSLFAGGALLAMFAGIAGSIRWFGRVL